MAGRGLLSESRSISQVVFNFLPGQIVSLRHRVWKSESWRDPQHLQVDPEWVRRDITRAINRFEPGDDGDLRRLLPTLSIEVVTPSDHGVEVSSFPRLYRCQRCGEISKSDSATCFRTDHRSAWSSFPFVAYHTCGQLTEPYVPPCPTHKAIASNQPRSRNARDVRFFCPAPGCSHHYFGVPFVNCGCGGGTYSLSPPGASTVYSGQSIIVINPPSPKVASDFAGAAARTMALDWILDGMPEANPLNRLNTIESVIESFERMGFDRTRAEAMARAAAGESGGGLRLDGTDVGLEGEAREAAMDAALRLAYATLPGRITVEDLRSRGEPQLRDRYEVRYPRAIEQAGLENVRLLEKFPVLTGFYGFVRGDGKRSGSAPKLNWFRAGAGRLRVYGLKADTEALLFQLNPIAVADYLARHGALHSFPGTSREARLAILREMVGDESNAETALVQSRVMELVHSFAHRVMREISAFSGIDREALAEYLVPEHLAFIVYANTRGDFVLGGIQALYENDLDRALTAIVENERRCALDPGCRETGSACMACMHVGEPSCRHYNRVLSREALFGRDGFFASVTAAAPSV